ncbi:MAG: hypothetical protein P4L43_13015 [Syntrophobacteraceae bacterium]|nr:hypothetical protein [Syntrophobacteraceae bacterium]
MSIRMVAVELYRLMKQIEELESRRKSLPEGAPEREDISNSLRGARALRDRLKRMIDGAKGD